MCCGSPLRSSCHVLPPSVVRHTHSARSTAIRYSASIAGITHAVDASAAVGAFLVGLAIPGPTAERARSVLRPLRDLFAAMFFLSFGLEVAPASLAPYLVPAPALGAVSSLTKLASGGYAAARAGVGRRGRLRAGSALVARGEFSLVIAGLAVTAGYDEIGPLASAYVVLLGVAGPLIAKYADRGPTTTRGHAQVAASDG